MARSDAALTARDASATAIDASSVLDSGQPATNPDAGFAPDATPVDSGVPPYPAPGAWGPNRGPGGPNVAFTQAQLYQNCAYLDGGSMDITDHHNLVTMFDGYLLMPWSPETGRGGLTFFDISDPCNPQVVGSGYSREMRETHSVGFSSIGGRWAVVNQKRLLSGGIQFWDVSNPAMPAEVGKLEVPGFLYPDAYARVTLSVFWQAPMVYVAGADNGVYIIEASNPRMPRMVGRYPFDPVLRAGQAQAIGNMLVITAAEGPRAVLLDISDPANPQPIPGGDFLSRDETGMPREAYFTNVANGFLWFARKDGGGGLNIYDIRDPTMPVRSGGHRSDGNGGYVFIKDNFAFVGESDVARIYDVTDHANVTEVASLDLAGDLDTVTPIGNVAVLSCDAEAERDQGSAIAPWRMEIDRTPPRVTWVYPPDGSTNLPITSRIGMTFNEFIDVKSAWEGSVRVYKTGVDPALGRVGGYVSAQEVIVNFWPVQPLEPNTQYTLEVPAGGVADFNGNAVDQTFTMTFRTGS